MRLAKRAYRQIPVWSQGRLSRRLLGNPYMLRPVEPLDTKEVVVVEIVQARLAERSEDSLTSPVLEAVFGGRGHFDPTMIYVRDGVKFIEGCGHMDTIDDAMCALGSICAHCGDGSFVRIRNDFEWYRFEIDGGHPYVAYGIMQWSKPLRRKGVERGELDSCLSVSIEIDGISNLGEARRILDPEGRFDAMRESVKACASVLRERGFTCDTSDVSVVVTGCGATLPGSTVLRTMEQVASCASGKSSAQFAIAGDDEVRAKLEMGRTGSFETSIGKVIWGRRSLADNIFPPMANTRIKRLREGREKNRRDKAESERQSVRRKRT